MYRDLLVGSTGFVGGNLRAKHTFAAVCHSSDIAAQYSTQPDLCVYAGVPAAMFLANADPEADMEVMRTARENLRKIAPKSLVLISSIAVFADSRGRCEDDAPDTDGLPAYGRNRLQLEQWVREDFNDALIVRLPALYGAGLKKNFLFDLHTITPAMLKPEKFNELAEKFPLVKTGVHRFPQPLPVLQPGPPVAGHRGRPRRRADDAAPLHTAHLGRRGLHRRDRQSRLDQ